MPIIYDLIFHKEIYDNYYNIQSIFHHNQDEIYVCDTFFLFFFYLFLGGPKQIDQLVKRNGGFCKYIFEFPDEEKGRKKIKKTYHIHIFRLDYDEKLIEYYNNCHQFLYEKLNHKLLASTKVFEKINIRWFTLEEMEQRRSSFRSFYRDIVDELIFEGNEIEKFVKSTIRNKK